MSHRRFVVLGLLVATVAFPGVALAQKSVADEEVMLFAYVENSYTWNLGDTSRGRVNDLRFYDFDDGYTFNIAELTLVDGTIRLHAAQGGPDTISIALDYRFF